MNPHKMVVLSGIVSSIVLAAPVAVGAAQTSSRASSTTTSSTAAQTSSPQSAAGDQAGPAKKGEAVFQTACSQCHSLDVVTSQRKTRADWDSTVNMMINQGAQLTDRQADEVVAYLAKTYPAPAQ